MISEAFSQATLARFATEVAKYPADQKQSAVIACLAIVQQEAGYVSTDSEKIVADYLGMEPIAVEQEAFSWDVVAEASAWLSDVTYAVENNEEAAKDQFYNICKSICPFFSSCRKDGALEVVRHDDPEIRMQPWAMHLENATRSSSDYASS